MRGAAVRVWTSPSNGAKPGYEALIEPLSPPDVAPSLRNVDLSQCADGSFLLIPLAETDHNGVQQAIESAARASQTLRIYLTIDDRTLERVDSRRLVSDRVGLVLDRLSLITPMGALIHDVIDAVRFDATFIADSLGSIRIDAALRAMLSLAKSLGLATLGSAAAGQGSAKIFEYPFDYVTKLASARQNNVLPVPPVEVEEKTVDRTARVR